MSLLFWASFRDLSLLVMVEYGTEGFLPGPPVPRVRPSLDMMGQKQIFFGFVLSQWSVMQSNQQGSKGITMQLGTHVHDCSQLLYTGKLSREKSFANWWRIRNSWRKLSWRKLSWNANVTNYVWVWLPISRRKLLWMGLKPRNSQRCSPSKVSHYTVLYSGYTAHNVILDKSLLHTTTLSSVPVQCYRHIQA